MDSSRPSIHRRECGCTLRLDWSRSGYLLVDAYSLDPCDVHDDTHRVSVATSAALDLTDERSGLGPEGRHVEVGGLYG